MSSDDWIRKLSEAEALQKALQAAENPLALEARAFGLSTAELKQALGLSSVLDLHLAGVLADQDQILRMTEAFGLEAMLRDVMAAGLPAAGISLASLQDHYLRAATELRDTAISFAFNRPNAELLADMARIASQTPPYLLALAEAEAREEAIRLQMASISSDWMAAQWPGLSAMAFGRVSSGADALLHADPFTEAHDTASRDLFGDPIAPETWSATDDDVPARDEARVDMGAEPGLLIIPAGARLSVGTSVGLVVPAPKRLRVAPLAGGETAFSSEADEWLRAAELHLRLFIVAALKRAFGDDWRKQLPPDLEPQWLRTRDQQLRAGRPEFDLVHYAHLGDWSKVILRHWKAIFAPVFGKPAYVETTFDHLIPLRNEDGHHRPTGELDAMVAITYSRQIVERIDRHVRENGWPPLDS